MAVVDRKPNYHIRPTNKEPEWSSLCNNVFDQYLEGDDLFDFGDSKRERSSSDDSGNLFDFSGSSEQSNQTSATSPNPSSTGALSVQSVETEAKQPKAKAPGDFWTKKLRALEQNAAECEKRQQKLRSTKSHPDFLSLGGYPSPPALPPSPTGQSRSAQRQTSRAFAANGNKTPTQRSVTNVRSVSRGRPMGVSKQPPASASASINPYATIRNKPNASPSKMMNPSRYRAGAFKDVWAERIQHSPKKFEIRLPSSQTFPDSPPPSARSIQDSFAAFGSPIAYGPPVPGCDDQISPLASTFQQAARVHTPIASPLLSPGGHGSLSYFDPAPPLPTNPYTTQTVPLNDTAPLCDDVSLAANRIQSFDFGFSSSPVDDAWSAAPFAEPATAPLTAGPFTNQDPFADFNNDSFGLGISCDPNLVSNYTTMPDTSLMPNPSNQSPPMSAQSPFYVPSMPNGLPYLPTRTNQPHMSPLPATPHHRRFSRSPSPPATESRSRRPSSNSNRRPSRHRRTKSTNSTPRQPQNNAGGGFVNFTPSDSGKILNGVAPSGSSKTKARREKEAADKRRRLSQAAMRAVMEAGGDVEALQKAGLLGT
ncbi:hypothetical protein PRZ48_005083 [Zasmidium cellare]|uniref:Developmental regulatory protein wetA n=1 Tax=Zasmidium cellare TaxID=395010 RepID=A0ABR0ERG2_ZASCE|nr:hypothetical protein PRZ48_005083 [Zasmidium cellare]